MANFYEMHGICYEFQATLFANVCDCIEAEPEFVNV
jgi:hypothetical protein